MGYIKRFIALITVLIVSIEYYPIYSYASSDSVQEVNSLAYLSDDSEYIIYESISRKATSGLRYGTIGMTISRVVNYDEKSGTYEVMPDYIAYTLKGDELYGNKEEWIDDGYIKTTFRIPYNAALGMIRESSETWYSEIIDAKSNILCEFNAIMTTIDNGIAQGYMLNSSSNTINYIGLVYGNVPGIGSCYTDRSILYRPLNEGFMYVDDNQKTPPCVLEWTKNAEPIGKRKIKK